MSAELNVQGCEEFPVEMLDFEFATSTTEVPTFQKECQRSVLVVKQS